MGRIGQLISAFKDTISLPVDVNDVLAKMREEGVDIAVEFIGVELDTLVLRGKYRLFEWPNGFYGSDPTLMANIYYHIKDDSDWQRFVCCKELTHLLDPSNHYTSTREQQVELATKVGLPAHLQDPLNAPIEVNIDFVAEAVATAILFPIAARDIFTSYVTEKKLSLGNLALIADIPERYVEMAMAANWPAIHARLLML
jgi:hypothetical protein